MSMWSKLRSWLEFPALLALFLYWTLFCAYELGHVATNDRVASFFYRHTLSTYGCRCYDWVDLPLHNDEECLLYKFYYYYEPSSFDNLEHGAELFSELMQRFEKHCKLAPDVGLLKTTFKMAILPWKYAFARGVVSASGFNGMEGWRAHMINEITRCRGPHIPYEVCISD